MRIDRGAKLLFQADLSSDHRGTRPSIPDVPLPVRLSSSSTGILRLFLPRCDMSSLQQVSRSPPAREQMPEPSQTFSLRLSRDTRRTKLTLDTWNPHEPGKNSLF
ncbi:unnamed protein product [Pleuronectes platessa]|uniref:Uncharacterized protein n=1 Tax=Pleuronectes platessa TaxID=8262 RepID=A0A9N7TIB3_PLEPL|nr:unnamed protein product [Pleuronectes platessa]